MNSIGGLILKIKIILLIIMSILMFSKVNASEILIIHSYHQGFTWTDRIQEGLDNILNINKGNTHIGHIEYLDSRRSNYDDLHELMHLVISAKHKDRKFDIIIVSDNRALEFAIDHRKLGHIRETIPIVFCGLNVGKDSKDRFDDVNNITGVYETLNLSKTIELIKILEPDVSNIGVVADFELQDNLVMESIETLPANINIEWIHDWTKSKIKEWVKQLPTNLALVIGHFHKSKDSSISSIKMITSLIYETRPDVSLYTTCDFDIGKDSILGGYVVDGVRQGKTAAELAEKILHGKDVNSIDPIYQVANVAMFDHSLLIKKNINPKLLPKSAVLLNSPVSLYDKYRPYFWIIFLLLILQFLVIVAFIIQRVARLRAEKISQFTKFAVDNMKDAVFWINKNGEFTYVNQAACSRLGYSKRKLMKKKMWDIHFNDFGVKDWEKIFIELKVKGWAILEHTHKTKNGKMIPVEVSATYVNFDKVDFIVAFARDITNRLENRKALENSERKYRTIYNTASVGMFQIDAISGKIISANPAHAKILGYDSIEELISKFPGWGSYTDRRKIHDLGLYFKEFNQIDNVPMIGTKKCGVIVDLEVSATYNNENQIIDGIILDVTDRKLAEKSLIEGEKKYRTLVETTPYGIEELDIVGKVLYVNDSFLKMMRMKKDEVVGHYIWEFVSEPEKDGLKELFRNLPEEQPPPTTYIGKNITKGGRSFDVQVDWNYKKDRYDNVIGFVGIVSDISDLIRFRKRQELSSTILDILNSDVEAELTIKKILTLVKQFTKLDAVAIRLQEDDDYPYYITSGFNDEFIERENSICSKDMVGKIIKHPSGYACLDCMCGMIICGNTNPDLPFFTTGGSFWTNNTDDLIKGEGIPEIIKSKTRNRCNAEGYRSVALIPLVSPDRDNIGLLQLNDRRKDMFTLNMIEFFEGIGASIGIALGRKQAQDLLKESEERYRNLFTIAPLAIIFWDEHTYIQEWNNHAEKIFGWTKEEVIGRNFFDFLIPVHEKDNIKNVVNVLLDNQISSHVINDNLTRSGRFITCEWNNTTLYDDKGNIKGVLSLGEDITEKSKAEKSLEDSEEKFRLVFRTIPDPIILIQASDGKIVDVNKGFEREYGYDRIEVIGTNVMTLYAWENVKDRNRFYSSFGKREHIDSMETTLTGKDGIQKSVLVSSSIIKINNEDHALSIIKDISGLKKAQEDLLEKERQLRRVSKMEAVGTLAGGVAHDFNNIVQIISGNLQLLMIKDNDSIKDQLDGMYVASMRGADLAKRLLTFSRRVESQLQSIDVNEEIRIAHKLLDRAATGPVMVNIDLELDTNLPFGLADPTQLNQVITNLCLNAKDAMPKGGHIRITTNLVELDESYCEKYRDATPGIYIKVCIIDTGIGMSTTIQERIFEPFFTTKEQGKGTGLGLAVVYGIMQSHGGYISVYSNVGEGTEFKLYIPVSNYKELDNMPREKDIELRGGKETILMIDDEEDIKTIGSRILTMYGYEVLFASDGASGLDVFYSDREKIDLIILDLIMPDMSGGEVLKQIISKYPETKIIVVSGYSSSAPINDAINMGAKSFVNKPYTLKELLQEVRKILDEED